MKTVTLEEKLIAQAKNISIILKSDMPLEQKIILLEAQKDYLYEYLDNIIQNLKG